MQIRGLLPKPLPNKGSAGQTIGFVKVQAPNPVGFALRLPAPAREGDDVVLVKEGLHALFVNDKLERTVGFLIAVELYVPHRGSAVLVSDLQHPLRITFQLVDFYIDSDAIKRDHSAQDGVDDVGIAAGH